MFDLIRIILEFRQSVFDDGIKECRITDDGQHVMLWNEIKRTPELINSSLFFRRGRSTRASKHLKLKLSSTQL